MPVLGNETTAVLAQVTATPVGPRPVRSAIGVRAKSRATESLMTESGVGALIGWADVLWAYVYPAQNGEGAGLGLYQIGDDGVPQLAVETNGTHVARLIFGGYLWIGDQRISNTGTITAVTGFNAADRICAYAADPAGGSTTLYALAMGGTLYSVDVATAVATSIAALGDASHLNVGGATKHFKSMTASGTGSGQLYVAVNNNIPDGRLGRVTTAGVTTSLDSVGSSWIEVHRDNYLNNHVWATGHDDKSALLRLYASSSNGSGRTFRIPFSHRQQRHYFQQEWMRIRQVETERWLMDLHGGFFQVTPQLTGSDDITTSFPVIEPICRHARTIPDFTVYNGSLVLGGNNNTFHAGQFRDSGQPAGSLLWTTLDDLWSWGRPAGTGFWWRNSNVTSGTTSEPMLMNGYGKKALHFFNNTGSAVTVDILVYVDGSTAYTYQAARNIAANTYDHFEFPDGFSADWCAIKLNGNCTDFTAAAVYS